MKRSIPCRDALSSTMRVPVTLVDRISDALLRGSAAAQWTTVSTSRIARSTAAASRMSVW